MEHAAILIVDDERSIVELVATVLKKEGFTSIDMAYSGEEALEKCEQRRYDLVLLDIMMPGASGLEICPFIRKTTEAPILFLTAKSSDFDVLSGFAVGGDDYIKKPFNPLEVVARVRAQLRKTFKSMPTAVSKKHAIYRYERFEVNEETASLIVDGNVVHCPALVFQLLLFLCKHPNRVFSKSELYEYVWGESMLNDDNTVMVHIHRIRERIELDPSNPQIIVNVRGIGYKLVPPRSSGGQDAS
ncbi:response regulator transcription factor [Paenibacillus septentrionalis]|uniref:Response regulator transcription factor n=1 Tax=Paenibacillus septentrionalis TaxID=429342 RepID=A0ABW1V258_9BACL